MDKTLTQVPLSPFTMDHIRNERHFLGCAIAMEIAGGGDPQQRYLSDLVEDFRLINEAWRVRVRVRVR